MSISECYYVFPLQSYVMRDRVTLSRSFHLCVFSSIYFLQISYFTCGSLEFFHFYTFHWSDLFSTCPSLHLCFEYVPWLKLIPVDYVPVCHCTVANLSPTFSGQFALTINRHALTHNIWEVLIACNYSLVAAVNFTSANVYIIWHFRWTRNGRNGKEH